MKFDRILIYFITITLYCSVTVESYTYLGILPSGARSHFIFGSSLFKALAARGHQVYVISAFPQEQPIPNYFDIPFEPAQQKEDEFGKIFDETNQVNVEYSAPLEMSEQVLSHPNVQKLMTSDMKFDAVICEAFFSEALFGFSEHFNARLILLGVTGAVAWNTEMIGSPTPTSYVPHVMMEYSDRMSFLERLHNLYRHIMEYLQLYTTDLPKQAALYAKYFPHLTKNLYTVRQNTAIVLLNTHITLSYPRPLVPNQIVVGGMHINRQRKPLPKDIAAFINEAKHGVIYFSVGTNLLGKFMPHAKKRELFEAFRSLKQRVLWKLEQKSAQGRHGNILIRQWFPQDDILAHKNVKAFITHCGFFSIIESIYHGKPIIGLPLLGDQFANMARAENRGIGIRLDFKTLTAKDVREAVAHVVNNANYSQRAKELSARFRSQPLFPLDLAVYWSEHVVRQKGVKYLHCAGVDLNFFLYYSIDVILPIIGFIIFVVFVLPIGYYRISRVRYLPRRN